MRPRACRIGEAEPTSRPASRLRAASRGSRCGGEDSSLQDLSVILSGDAVSHGYGLATVSGERAWLCPQFPPLPEWLRPPPARGHPVSSRGRIERHGAHKATKDRGRSRGLRREPVRGAACQSEMYQFIWCSGTHRAAWRSTMPETVALAILRFGSRCNRAIWINSGCWERSHLGWVAKGLGALARGPNQTAGQRPGVSDLWHSPLCYCWS